MFFLLVYDPPFYFIFLLLIILKASLVGNKDSPLQSMGVVIPAFVVVFVYFLSLVASPAPAVHSQAYVALPRPVLLTTPRFPSCLLCVLPCLDTNKRFHSITLFLHLISTFLFLYPPTSPPAVITSDPYCSMRYSLTSPLHSLRRRSSSEHCRSHCCRRSIVPCMSEEDRHCKSDYKPCVSLRD